MRDLINTILSMLKKFKQVSKLNNNNNNKVVQKRKHNKRYNTFIILKINAKINS